MVSSSPDSGQLEIVRLLDWQHAPSSPASSSPVYQIVCRTTTTRTRRTSSSFPPNADKTEESEQMEATGLHHACLVHYHYTKGTEELNKLHYDALLDPASTFICPLFYQAGTPWEAETHDLKALLIEATEE
jgi:hypothetical protein